MGNRLFIGVIETSGLRTGDDGLIENFGFRRPVDSREYVSPQPDTTGIARSQRWRIQYIFI
jgi:hypothetical protein